PLALHLPRRVQPARGHRLPGHDHHRGHGQHPRLHLRCGVHDPAARGAQAQRHVADRRLSERLRADRLRPRHRLRPGHHLLPDVRAAGPGAHLDAVPELLEAVAVRLLITPKEDVKVLLVLGYGTPDTEALRPFITKDKMPYISGSYSGHLTDPKMTPYNFPGGIDYTSQIRIFLNWVKEGWKDTSRKPKVAFIF